MATARPCLAQLSRLCLSSPRPIQSSISLRFLSTTVPCAAKKEKPPPGKGQNPQKNKKKGVEAKKKKKTSSEYIQYDMNKAEMFSLCDAMRYIFRAEAFLGESNAAVGIFGPSKWDRNQRL
jgi:large subunit ribosomal protein L1